jgi:hypothetical protein
MWIGDPQALQNPAYRLADVDLGRSAEPRRAPATFFAPWRRYQKHSFGVLRPRCKFVF